MSIAAAELAEQALMLPVHEREELAERLLSSLHEPDPRIDALWLAECRRRSDAFDRGETESYDWDEVLADMDKACE